MTAAVRPITLEPPARSQIQALSDEESGGGRRSAAPLGRLARTVLEVDLYMPGGLGPIPYDGVLLTEHTEAAVTFYVEHIRVVVERARA